jgi:NitT/TauT family transport system permease protein
MKISRTKQTMLWCLVIILLWEVAPRLNLVSEFILPPFSDVFITMVKELSQGKLGIQVFESLLLVLEGFILSFVLSVVLALLSVKFSFMESFCNAVCTIFTPLPGVAMLPLIMMWFGVNKGAMIALIIHSVLWPMLTNIVTGFRSVPEIYTDYARNIQLNSVQLLTQILLYSVMPYFISGLKIGWGRAWRALISSEMIFGMIGSLGGLGYYIYTNRAYANMTNVMAGVLIVIVIGILAESVLFNILERNTVKKWGMDNG